MKGSGDNVVFAPYVDKESCEAAKKPIYVPEYVVNKSYDDAKKYFDLQVGLEDVPLYCKTDSYRFYNNCKEKQPSSLVQVPNPHFNNMDDCKEAIAKNKQHIKYLPNCNHEKSDDNCQYFAGYIDGDNLSQNMGGKNVPYNTKKDMCG